MKKLSFINDLLNREADLAQVCSRISYKDEPSQPLLDLQKYKDPDKTSSGFYSINHVPGYLSLTYDVDPSLAYIKFPYLQGFSICLDGYKDISEYMSKQLKKKTKGNVMRGHRRLYEVFDIQYDMYFGKIDEERCMVLLAQLKAMIITRFQERKEQSATLSSWQKIRKNLYRQILEKKASLHVISHAGEPLAISVSYHYGSLYFYYISSYDISYSKFGLGHIMLYEQLNWCFENNKRYFEMAWTELDYKRRWCNKIHVFEHHLLFRKNSITKRLRAYMAGKKSEIIGAVQGKWYYEIYTHLKQKLSGDTIETENFIHYSLLEVPQDSLPGNLAPVNIHLEGNEVLKRGYNDFLYATQDRFSDVAVFKSSNDDDYYIIGKSTVNRICFNSPADSNGTSTSS